MGHKKTICKGRLRRCFESWRTLHSNLEEARQVLASTVDKACNPGLAGSFRMWHAMARDNTRLRKAASKIEGKRESAQARDIINVSLQVLRLSLSVGQRWSS